MKKLITVAFAVVATPIFANPDPLTPVPAPEISALDGGAAIAALVAIVLLTWERRRRAA